MFGSSSNPVAQVQPAEVEQKLASTQPPLLVDVRQPDEYAQGHIPGARLIPLGTLPEHLAELPKDREIVAVCRSGARSANATLAMRQAGLNAVNMVGGMLAWRGPVER
ncbi:MAG TPA: rhodanese-like domain-containing protein [Oscillatoriaceae cyanobacterium]